MPTMTKEGARVFLAELGELSPGLKKLFTEFASKAEAKKEADVIFPKDPQGEEPWGPEVRLFHLLFEEMQLFMTLGHAVTVLSEEVLKVELNASREGNKLKLLKAP